MTCVSSGPQQQFPPTLIVVHPRERRSKCTVAALRGRKGFIFRNFGRGRPPGLENYVRLGFGGPLIGPQDSSKGLLILDGTWRWTEVMERDFAAVPSRSLPALRTAYPRVSKTYDDPPQGLATIEALYAAYRLLGRSTDGLLDDYRWAEDFLRLNRDVLRSTA